LRRHPRASKPIHDVAPEIRQTAATATAAQIHSSQAVDYSFTEATTVCAFAGHAAALTARRAHGPRKTPLATWAYGQTEAAGGLTWLRADEMLPLGPGWRGLLP
jgi:hypothetical protein